MKAKFYCFLITLTLFAGVHQAVAQLPVITSFSQNGQLVCANLATGTVASVEWASTLSGPWNTNWAGLDAVTVNSNGTITVGVPMFERMAAGDPVVASPESVGTMWLPREMVGSGAFFAVRVVGDSMVNANIFDGDWVVVRQQDAARNGDIVAALIDEEAMVKTFHFASGHVWLMPQNPRYQPILGDHCRVMGKVITTVRRPCTDAQITAETGPGAEASDPDHGVIAKR